MSLAKWSCLRIVQEFAKRTGLPRPTILDSAERTNNPVFTDIIDILDDVIQQLTIRICPEEVITTALLATNEAREVTGVSIGNGGLVLSSATSMFVAADEGKKFRMVGYPCVFTIVLYGNDTHITLNTTYLGTTVAAGEGTGYIYEDTIELPADFYRQVTAPGRFITPATIDCVPPTVFQASKFSISNNFSISLGVPRIVTLVAGSTNDRALQYAPIDTVAYNIEIHYYKRITTFSEQLVADDDGATGFYCIIPAEHQSIIIDAALREYYAFQSEDQRYKFADAHMNEKLSMIADNDETRGILAVRPHISRGRRRLFVGHSNFQRLCSKYDLGDWFDILGDD